MALMQQQHEQLTRKRSSENGGNGGPDKRKMAEEEADKTKEDLEDGANMSIQVQVTEVAVAQAKHSHVHTGTQGDQPCCIQSVLRSDLRVGPGEAYGNLLKAGSHRTSKTIDVAFTGTDPSDHATEFYLEKSHDKQADALSYRSGSDNYYLKVKRKTGQVNLRKLVKLPTDDKYYFRIKRTGPEREAPFTFLSLKTNKYLACSDDGKVSANGAPEDRNTWFQYKPSSQIQDYIVQYQEMDMTFAQNESDIQCKTRTVKVAEDAEDSGKENSTSPKEENSEEAQKENLEVAEVGNSADQGKEECDDTGRGNSRDPGEVTPGSPFLEKKHSGEPEKGNLEEPSKGNCNDLAGTENSKEKSTSV